MTRPHKAPQDKQAPGRPMKYVSPTKMRQKLEEYFANQDNKGKPYTVSGMALWLGISRPTLDTYQKRKDKFSDVIAWAKLKCENFNEEMLYSGKNPIGPIFSLKNNYGWSDKKELDTKSQVEIKMINYSEEEEDNGS